MKWIPCAAAFAVGCVSPATWNAVREAERGLGEPDIASGSISNSSPVLGERGMRTCAQATALVLDMYPGLRAPRMRAQAALATARAEGALPAPRIDLRIWDFPIADPQAAGREGMYMVGLSQEIPPSAARDGRARAAAEEAHEALSELAELRRQIRAVAAHTCADWGQSAAESSRLADAEVVLEHMRDMMHARFVAGGERLTDLARIEAELARIARMRAETDARRVRAEARMNALLGREADAPIAEPPALSDPTVPHDIDALADQAVERRGLIRGARARARAAEARARAAEARATVPAFMLGAMYMQTPSMRPGAGVEVGMTLPWFWSGEGSARDAARLEADAELDDVLRMECDVRVDVVSAARMIDLVHRALDVIRTRERPATERALEAIAATYAAGEVDLIAWLDAVRALRQLDLEEVRLLGEGAHALAELESAVGWPMVPTDSRSEQGP